MPTVNAGLKNEFQLGSSHICIQHGDILSPGFPVDAIVSTDDNYLTMDSGLSRQLRERAGPEYIRAARKACPVKAGSVIDTPAFELPEHGVIAKHVLHAAVINYDNRDLETPQIVFQATLNCLERAEELGLSSVIFPALATGAGNLPFSECAEQMCSAIKCYLAQEGPLKNIYIFIYKPKEPDQAELWNARYLEFIQQSNLVLDVPYNPGLGIRQARDFFGREAEIARLEAVLTGELDGKRHAVILGGPQTGKWTLLDQLYFRAQKPESLLGQGRQLVKVTFGQVHQDTSASFVYRKFLCAMAGSERDTRFRETIRCAYLEQDLNCDRFLKFLEDHADRYPQVVFMVDHLPELIKMEDPKAESLKDVRAFWRDLDRLEERVSFVYTARDDNQYQLLKSRLDEFTLNFKNAIEEVRVGCVDDLQRDDWVDALFTRYFDSTDFPEEVYDFFAAEAGFHPYLISLAGYALILAIKRYCIEHPEQSMEVFTSQDWNDFFRLTRKIVETHRYDFFVSLLQELKGYEEELEDLKNLAWAISLEERQRVLQSGLSFADPNAIDAYQQIQKGPDPRRFLHEKPLNRLEALGYLVDAGKRETARFMVPHFAVYLARSFGLLQSDNDRPLEVGISLLSQDNHAIRTLFSGRGARITTAEKHLSPAVKKEFLQNFGTYIHHHLHPNRYPERGVFTDVEEISNYILTQFTTIAVKRYLDNPPKGCTIFFTIDDQHQDIPWELMLEAAYAGEIPFRVGRSIASQQPTQNIRPAVRGATKIKALLIGDPTDDLPDSREEIQELARWLRKDSRFEDPEVMIGSEQTHRIRLLNALSSGRYGLLHYSGHTWFAGGQSAWHLKDGDLTTDMLTNAVQMAPPAFVFSSSCESAAAGKAGPIRYEDQTFDLPGAFLQAGVEAYIGTLWEVDSPAASAFVEKFYSEFLESDQNLGECLRRTGWDRKQIEEREGKINWLAFILYGDPRTKPSDLYPALKKVEEIQV